MADYQSWTIKELIKKIDGGKVILPAMQRSFVWPEQKIYNLFDSLMRGFPIGTCLFWEIDAEELKQVAFNQFIKVVDDQKLKMQRGDSVQETLSEYIAVLDGQQRITSFYVGVSGYWRTHMKGKKYDDESSYFNRYLCIDLMHVPQTEEDKYPFMFVPENQIGQVIEENGERKFWLKVADVFDENFKPVISIPRLNAEKLSLPPEEFVRTIEMVNELNEALKTRAAIYYYPSKEKRLPEVVEIFVRVNSGGQKLAASDLMLSVAFGAQGDIDVHKKIKEAVDEINSAPKKIDNGFKVDNELILTAGLLFTGASSLSLQKQENFSREKMNEIFINNWESIIDAISNTVKCIEFLGFDGKKLSSKSLILPIAYYFYKNKLQSNHISGETNRSRSDRIFIRQWIIRSLVNDVFMDGTGSTLTRIRSVIETTTHKYFPLDELMVRKIKQPLFINEYQIDDICDLNYSDVKILPILMEIAQYGLLGEYEVDHIWPKDLMNKKTAIRRMFAGADDETLAFYIEKYNTMPNLQLLPMQVNRAKSNSPFGDWIAKNPPDTYYYRDNCIPQDISYEYNNFKEFYELRKQLIKDRIKTAFPDDLNVLAERYGLKLS